jgi:hypothetical protein
MYYKFFVNWFIFFIMEKIDIDFDHASTCWRENKKYKGNGQFVYICEYTHTNGKRCRRTIAANVIHNYHMSCINFEVRDKYKNHPNKFIYCKRHLNCTHFKYAIINL